MYFYKKLFLIIKQLQFGGWKYNIIIVTVVLVLKQIIKILVNKDNLL